MGNVLCLVSDSSWIHFMYEVHRCLHRDDTGTAAFLDICQAPGMESLDEASSVPEAQSSLVLSRLGFDSPTPNCHFR